MNVYDMNLIKCVYLHLQRFWPFKEYSICLFLSLRSC